MSPFISVRFLQAQTDARLLSLAAEGYDRAFEALVRRYRRQLLAYSLHLIGSSSRAEDAVQRGLLQAWIALQRGTEVRDAKSWFYRIVHNTALNMQRGTAQDYAQLSDSAGIDAGRRDIEAHIQITEVFTELAALPPMQREALLRTSLEGASHDEVATALGLSAKAVRGLVYRARASMRAAAGAMIPSPLVNWALSAGKPSVGAADRIGELLAGGGGLATIAVNGGVAAVAVGALAAGVAVAPHGHAHAIRHAQTHVRRDRTTDGGRADGTAWVAAATAGAAIAVSASEPSRSATRASPASRVPVRPTSTTHLNINGLSTANLGGSDSGRGAGPRGDGVGSGSSSGAGSNGRGGPDPSRSGGGSNGRGVPDRSESGAGDHSDSSGSGAGGSGSREGAHGSGGSDSAASAGADSRARGSGDGGMEPATVPSVR